MVANDFLTSLGKQIAMVANDFLTSFGKQIAMVANDFLTSFSKQIAMVPTDFLTSFSKQQEIFAVLHSEQDFFTDMVTKPLCQLEHGYL
ncbi:hypothetical protein [Caldifermentibacillus hisashii]|uniref:hypothetical protein n=1 Tax=Caldifermentibacillus hisashii TaxID=996558 RepID=UPI0031013C33